MASGSSGFQLRVIQQSLDAEMLRFVLHFGESAWYLVWGLGAQNLSGFDFALLWAERGEGEPWRPPSSSTWHASRCFSNSPGLDLGFGRRTFSRLKDRGPTSNPFFHRAACTQQLGSFSPAL